MNVSCHIWSLSELDSIVIYPHLEDCVLAWDLILIINKLVHEATITCVLGMGHLGCYERLECHKLFEALCQLVKLNRAAKPCVNTNKHQNALRITGTGFRVEQFNPLS